MRYMILIFLFFTTVSSAENIEMLSMMTEEYDQCSDKKLKLNSSVQIFTFTEEYGVTGYIKKIPYNASKGKGKSAIPEHMQTAYILQIEWRVKIVDDIDTAKSAPLVEEIQLIVPKHLLEYTRSAVKKYRKVHVEGKFLKAHKEHHVRDIVMDVKRISIVK